MPNRDGTGPRGAGRNNRRGDGQCRRNNAFESGRRMVQGVQQVRRAGITSSRTGALLGLVTAMLPMLAKITKLIASSDRKNREALEKPATKAVIVEPPPQLPDKRYET